MPWQFISAHFMSPSYLTVRTGLLDISGRTQEYAAKTQHLSFEGNYKEYETQWPKHATFSTCTRLERQV